MEEEKIKITDDDDFVMIERGGQILSGGFHVNSILLKHKKSPMHTLNKNLYGGGGEVSDIFKDLAIPAGIFYQPTQSGGRKENVISEEDIDEDIYTKLTKLASVEENRSKNNDPKDAMKKHDKINSKSKKVKNQTKKKVTKKNQKAK